MSDRVKWYNRISVLFEEINKTEWYRNPIFLEKLLKRKTLVGQQHSMLVNCIIPGLEELYGDMYHLALIAEYNNLDDYYDYYDYYRISHITIYIRYPKVTVRNGKKNQSTELTNHFQNVTVELKTISPIYIMGMLARTINPTIQQYNFQYAHSHLSSCEYDNLWMNFCLGTSSTEYNVLRKELNKNIDDVDLWYMFLMNLRVMAETESLAGRPYIHLSKLSLGEKGSDQNIFRENDYINSYNGKIDLLPVNWAIENGVYKVVDDEKLEKHCLIHGENNDDYSYHTSHVLYKDTLGNYYSSDRENGLPPSYMTWEFTEFKDHVYPFALSEGETTTDNQIYIHPKLKKYVKNKLEYRANKAAIQKSCERTNS